MDDVNEALAAFPEAEVLMRAPDGMPTFIVGELMKVGEMQFDDAITADNVVRPQLAPLLKVFRLTPNDLALRKMNVDEDGHRHFRYVQVKDGAEIVGGDLIVHVDIKGAVYGVNGTARGDVGTVSGSISESQAMARVTGDNRFAGLAITNTRSIWLQTQDGEFYKTFETTVEGKRGVNPARDRVYVDVESGNIVAVYPQIHFAKNRAVYSANNGTSLPGTLRRSEGQAATTDTDVNAAYDNTGSAYQAYFNFWSRDSYNNAGAQLRSTVHYSNNYCNAFWNGTQMVYGDGSGSDCLPLARSVDVTAHELTHAVTENESGLVYSGESGGMNEALSDIFGAFVEAWVDGGSTGTTLQVSANTWLVGEDILPPYLRKMNDPAADGASRDEWTSGVGNVDVHYSSGVGNLAFYLLSQGGTHPRGKTTINVPGIGLDKAIRIMYKAQTDYLTSNSNFAAVRTAMENATTALGYDQATKDAVGCAWAAVKVGTAPTSCGGTNPPPPPPPTGGVLTNNVPVSNISGASQSLAYWTIAVPTGQTNLTVTISGGTGDADMYVNFGSQPTTTVYQCRPYLNGNSETCTFNPPQAGTYHIMLRGYTAYSGVTLKAVYSATTPPSGDPYLTNGTPVTGISGASASAKYWRIAVPAGKNLTVRIMGGTGDADMYTRFGARPTTTTYACRPYLNGNTETCTHNNASVGDWYVMLRGYTAYSGVSLVGSY